MFCLIVLVAVGITWPCFGTTPTPPPHPDLLDPLHHFCSLNNTSDDFLPWCSCDASCKVYGDCCLNSHHYDKDQQMKGVNDYKCADYSTHGEDYHKVYTKVRCSEDWDNAEVQALCLKGDTLLDPTKRLPVTNTTTACTYVNHYCAICNGEDPDSLRMWYGRVECTQLPKNFYNEDYAIMFHDRTWGVIVPSLGLSSFTRCSFYITMPEEMRKLTMPCEPTVTTCNKPRSEEHDQNLCQSYTAPVYYGSIRFKNQHCANCNGYTRHGCGLAEVQSSASLQLNVPLTILMDFTDRTGSNRVGYTGPCGPEEVWDRWSTKCRKIICPKPGEKFSYDNCVAIDDDTTLTTKKQELLCPLHHSCSVPFIHDRGCSCDASCRIYGTCCRDSEYYDETEQKKNVNEYVCAEYPQNSSYKHQVYMKVKCSESWDNTEVRELCLKGNTLPDPTQRLPVTSISTGTTYVNHYCAICNGEDPTYLRKWYAYVVCKEVLAVGSYHGYGYSNTQDYENYKDYGNQYYEDYDVVHSEDHNTIYIEGYDVSYNKKYNIMFDNGTWGVHLPGSGVSSFIPCKTDIELPHHIHHLVTWCAPTITTCSDPESEEHERALCQSYAAAVYHGDIRFRNQHCASCNGYKEYTCDVTPPPYTPPFPYCPTLVIDFSSHASLSTQLAGPCDTEEVWDKWSLKCVKILCTKSGEKFFYDRCVPVEDYAIVNTTKQELLCPYHHSCRVIHFHNPPGCSCDTTCRTYGDCCRDFEYYAEYEQAKNVNEYMCVEYTDTHTKLKKHLYMRGKCSEDWDNAKVHSLCLKGDTLPDPAKRLPVTSTTTGRTYVNHYCAICNDEDPAYLMVWYAYVICKGVLTAGNYDIVMNDGKWGVGLPGSNISSFTPCQTTFAMPVDIQPITSHCLPTVTTCSDPESEEHERTLCHSYTAAVYNNHIRFRNHHCASCNGYQKYSCDPTPFSFTPTLLPTFIFDFNNLTGSCSIGEVWNRSDRKCRKVICPKQGETFTSGKCALTEVEVTFGSETNNIHLLPTSSPTDDCLKVLLSETEFTRQANGSVYVPSYGRTYQAGEYEAREGSVLVCWSADSWDKFSPTLGWVSLAGLCISCLALVLHLTAFCLVPSLRNLSGQCLASLCLSLLAAYTTLLFSVMDPPTQAGCTALAAAMYYFFLCSFAWMTAIAFDVWYTFRLTQRELRVAGGSQSHRFLAYSLCSWLLPAVSMAVLVMVDQLEPQGVSENFLPRLGEGLCWISHRKSLLVFFATPMAALTLMNVVFFAGTAAIIAKMNRSAATLAATAAGPQRPKRYWTFLRLAVLMGLTWTTGILAGCLDLEALWYVFVVLNSLQGVFIFLTFTCRTKVFHSRQWAAGATDCCSGRCP